VTKKLHLAHGLALPLDAVTQTFAILAMRGVGKTYTASVFAEELSKAELPFAVLDPTGAWWGLRASADGKESGYPVTILGGDHADAPLEETAGRVIADLLAEEAPPLILDMSLLSKSAMRRFVADFAERLYEKNRNPLHVIIDEADAFAPQKPRSDELRMLGAIDEIVRRGRIRGLGCTLVTQRSSVLNKDVLTQAEILIALRTAHPRDRAPVLEWMKVHATDEQLAAVEESLAKLPKGDAWVMSAGWLDLFKRVHIRKRLTFNSSATPEAGQRRIEPRKLAPVDLDVLRKKMAETIERAKAQDPRALQAKIVELQAELKKARAAKEPKAKVEIREVYVLKEGQLKRIEALFEKGLRIGGDIKAGLADLAKVVEPAIPSLQHPPGPTWEHVATLPKTPQANRPPPVPHPRPFPRAAPATSTPKESGELSGYAMHLVQTVARRHPMALTRSQISTLSGRSPRSSAFDGAMSELLKAGILAKDHDLYMLTDEGLTLGGANVGQPQSPEEVRAHWLRALPGYEATLLEALMRRYPQAFTREELSAITGKSITSSAFDGAISSLRKNRLATVEHGQVRASDTLFMEASA
jgi:hypothetical protein